ncbi:MAG: hypothetical protein LBT33_09220 [Spirochaetia bacterium]|jgi:hypothetical protein|nr:hypothetical protein [Spirochaetia bacterium]
MPLIEDIQPFIATLNSLGHEPEILAKKGESLEPVVPPSEGLPENVRQLLENSSPPATGAEESPAPEGPETGEEEASLNFSQLFDPEAPPAENGGLPGTEEGLQFPEDPSEGGPVPDIPEEGPAGDETGGMDADLEGFLNSFSPEQPVEEEEAAPAEPGDQPGGEEAETPEAAEQDVFDDLPESNEEFTISDDEPPATGGKKTGGDDDLANLAIPGMEAPDLGGEGESPVETEDPFAIPDFPEAEDGQGAEENEAETGAGGLDINDLDIPEFTSVPDDGEAGVEGDAGIEDLGAIGGEEAFPEAGSTEGEEGFPLPDEMGFESGIELPGEEEAGDGEQPGGEPEAAGPASHDEYSLGDFGTAFGIQEDIPGVADEAEINIPEGTANVIDATAGASFTLSEEDFQKMRETLQALPLNIKIVIEELIGDQKADEAAQMDLIRMLVKGASVRSLAAAAGKLAGRTLVVPKGYLKSSGTAWEEEKGGFAYFLKETFWPVFKIVGAGVLAASLLIFLGYRFIYQPIHAHILLERGLEMVGEDRFREGNELFAAGYREWAFKDYYFEYAGKFIEKKQYQLAREKYEQLLGEYNDYLDAKGVRTERKKDSYFTRAAVEYAHFESVLLENFEGAERVLSRLLSADMYSYAGLLEAGDNYVRWAEYDEKRFYDKYEEARKAYATALEAYGEQDEILFRFLDVFIHTDTRQEVLRIKNYFEARPKKTVDPARYAELGGYLLDKNESVGEVRQILFRALEADKSLADIHYQLARFYNKREEPRDERLALDNAIHLYGAMQPTTRKGLWRLVDSYGRSGELHARQKSFLEAEGAFKQGIERYEDGIKKTLIKKDAVLGRLYQQLGDIYYYQSGDLEAAYAQFVKAEDSLVRDPGLYYKKGFISYTQENYADALREFVRTEESFPSSRNLLFALGNANYMRNNFSVAEGYYSYLGERLEADRRRVGEILPDDRSSDRALLLNLIKAYNNLGVILYKMGQRRGDTGSTSRALVLWANSTELATNYARERETYVRRDTKDLAYLNLRQILNPLPDYELQIYQSLPRDMNEPFF